MGVRVLVCGGVGGCGCACVWYSVSLDGTDVQLQQWLRSDILPVIIHDLAQ